MALTQAGTQETKESGLTNFVSLFNAAVDHIEDGIELDSSGVISVNSTATALTAAASGTNLRITSTATDPASAPIVQFGLSGKPVQVKVQGRPNDVSTLEVRSRTTKASAITGMGIDAECEIRPATTATGGYARGVMGVCRIETGKTLAGTVGATGLYGQWRADGTVNGDVFASAIYGLIEDGGTYTACNHVAALWLDNHLTKTVTAGKKSFVYMTNNGGIAFDNGFYIYGGTAAQGITNLFNLDTCTDSGMVSANVAKTGAQAVSTDDYRLIRIVIDGVVHYLLASTVPTA